MKEYEELRERVKSLKRSLNSGFLIPITKDSINLIDCMEKKEMMKKQKFNSLYGKMVTNKKEDVTKEYENMIHAFECDFSIAFNYGDYSIFDDLKHWYESKNKRLLNDTEKLQELCFGLRYGILKIYKVNKEDVKKWKKKTYKP